jgi:hypothetical protein
VREDGVNCDKPNRSRAGQLQQKGVEATNVIRYQQKATLRQVLQTESAESVKGSGKCSTEKSQGSRGSRDLPVEIRRERSTEKPEEYPSESLTDARSRKI